MELTPMMKQFRDIKAQYPDAVLLFRCGDFYETYCEDAVLASEILGITLTHRSNGSSSAPNIDMAGFPFHALDIYLPKLVRSGHRVAICDQLEDPKLTKKLVRRGVTELVTPGVSYSDTTINGRENNFLACVVFPPKKQLFGIAFLDITTGEFFVAEGAVSDIDKLLNSFAPKEVLYCRGLKDLFLSSFGTNWQTYELDDWMLSYDAARERLLKQFSTISLKGLGVDHLPSAITAAGGILHYLDITQHLLTAHIQHLQRIEGDHFVWLDRFTFRNLELLPDSSHPDSSLFSVINRTRTPMGQRLLTRWISFPLKSVDAIRRRQSVVEYFFRQPDAKDQLANCLGYIGDLERLITRASLGRIMPRELRTLSTALEALVPIKDLLLEADVPALRDAADQIDPCSILQQQIDHTIALDPPAVTNRAGYIAAGVSDELDRIRAIQRSSKDYLIQLQQREIAVTGISSLKIGYNNVFGYYLEVRNTYKDAVPASWIRKQTLANAERYITEELKQYEEEILSADDKIQNLEAEIYQNLLLAISQCVPAIQHDASLLAEIDCLLGFAEVAADHRYVCPVVNDSLVLDIHQGRHPVIEQRLPRGENYIANDVLLDNQTQQIIIITGPNMAGKSALLRQTALIVLLSQIGSFVPADSATIGVVDKIFTRVGASDNIAMGESTFMVEMNEAASILNNLSERSLVLFDELGRGTSTYDGISIAWAIVEYIHEHPGHAKTLFATHYHELNEMEQSFSRIRNFNVSVREVDNKVLFLRKLVRGGSEHSFGIHVAQMAGLPRSIVQRADQILASLEAESKQKGVSRPTKQIAEHREGMQLSFIQLDDPTLCAVRDEILSLDVNALTPLEALNKLNDIQRIVKGK